MRQKDRKGLLDLLSSLFGDITLLESYNLSGRQLNLTNQFRPDQLVVMNYKDDERRCWLLDEGHLEPGCPRDQLLGTPGRDLINTMYTIRQMLHDTSLQLQWTISSTVGWAYRAGTCFGHSAVQSSCVTTDASATSLLGSSAAPGHHRSAIFHHPHINGTKIVIAPPRIVSPLDYVRYVCSEDFQMGQGLKRAYQHACLVK
ncbi:hypothetical protein GNI_038870 [Gregarina niphandrodes]|uniref:Uncharacterized protein n=1 Tax=Gregarina niphandrodes TaxID=110365 RepID=A0A023BAF2_GRENI|nr:hypothetical protein GNI_038870 [Gregarina niphandrodes]EZG78265.1 hypothetical protein GNI_038870 [Gregarina niphandrodes]|eukprot:XP_011129370.1 hypothetical protein GNI_038870 [Gregarina niphandrodes]